MPAAKKTAWIPIRRSNLKYYDKIELYYRNPYGKIVLYKPQGMKFSDESLQMKPYLGDLFVRPKDKLKALREAQRGFSLQLTRNIMQEGVGRVKEELIGIIGETLAEPRSGSLTTIPETMETIVDGFSRQPEIIKNLARISHTDYSTTIHSINVMALTVGYCFYSGRSHDDTVMFGLSALLHDLGKTEIPGEILTSPSSLSDSEFTLIKTHPLIGADILKSHGAVVESAISGALEHHEKLDGSGYPKGTTDISEIGQLLSIVDCYEAITNDERPYRSAMQPLKALEILKEETDAGRFNRKIFENFAYSLTDFSSSVRRKSYDHLFVR
jgi:HD-GYP domain-containing protein (c-di-GMP phosphodiesterase class II)